MLPLQRYPPWACVVDVGGADYEDVRHSRSKNSARKRSTSMTCATRQFGAPAARRVWPLLPTTIRTGCHRARLASTASPTAKGSCRCPPPNEALAKDTPLILSAFRPQSCHMASDRQLPDVVRVVISDDQTTPKERVLAGTVGHRREKIAGRIPDELDDGFPILVELRERPSPLGWRRASALFRPVALWKGRLLI